MPELPEVETVRRGLAPAMEGAKIDRLELRRKDLRFPFPENFSVALEGKCIEALGRRAKYLLIHIQGGLTVIAHLGMSGSFRIEDAHGDSAPGQFHLERVKNEKHDHVIFHLDSNNGPVRVIYNDPRRFGFMLMTDATAIGDHPMLKNLGPEPTGNSLSDEYLASVFANKKQPLKSALLDQANIAGLGNIYVCEALYRAGISPTRAAASLVTRSGKPTARLTLLEEAIRTVIAEAIESGGSSLKDHIQADGSLGYFQHHFAVYDREGEPCRTDGCGQPIKRLVQAGRSTFYCAKCQK